MKYIMVCHYDNREDRVWISDVKYTEEGRDKFIENVKKIGIIAEGKSEEYYFSDCECFEQKIIKVLTNGRISGELIHFNDKSFEIEVNWGDWKHDHIHLDNLITGIFDNVSIADLITTEEDGSDNYSAIHRYIIT